MIDIPRCIKDFGYEQDWLNNKKLRKESYRKAKKIYKQELKKIDWCNLNYYFEYDINELDNFCSETDEYAFFPYAIAKEWLEEIRDRIGNNKDMDVYRDTYKNKYLKTMRESRNGAFCIVLFYLFICLFAYELYACSLLMLYVLLAFLIAHLISKLEYQSFLEHINVFNYTNFKKILLVVLAVFYIFVFPLLVAIHVKNVAKKSKNIKTETVTYNNERPYDIQEELNQSIPLRFRH